MYEKRYLLNLERYERSESPNVKKAKELVEDLVDIKDQVKTLVAEKENLNNSSAKSHNQTCDKTELSSFSHEGPCPLDGYLKMPDRTEASPYKAVPELSFQHFNAPVLAGFKDARSILQKVQQNRGILEANMEAVLHARQNVEVYNMLQELYTDSVNPERAKIQKMVDKNIQKLRREVEREVTDDLVLRELGKAKATGVPGAVKVPAPAPAKPVGRYGIRARQQEPREEPRKPAPAVKKPTVYRPPPKRSQSVFEDEGKLTQVYGKAAYQKGRTTVKDPYLHYQNTAKQKAPRPAGVVQVKGKEKMSSKTQTADSGVKQFYFNPNTGTYIPVAAAGAPVSGQLVPMAVPLGGPRMDPGMSVASGGPGPVTFSQGHGPQVTAAGNVAMVTVGGEDTARPAHELGKQILPAVDIDTDASEISEIMDEVVSEVKARSPGVRPKKHVQIISPQSSPVRSPSKSPGRKSPGKAHYKLVYLEEPEEATAAIIEEREEKSVSISNHSLTQTCPMSENNNSDPKDEPVTEKREENSIVSISSLSLTQTFPKTENCNNSSDPKDEAVTEKREQNSIVSISSLSLTQSFPKTENCNNSSDPKDEAVAKEKEEKSIVSVSSISLTYTYPLSDNTNNSSDDTLVEDDVETAPGLEFPGYQPAETPEVPYNGPAFPPRQPPTDRQMTSDLIAEDIKRRDLLQNKAMDWLEQELMARVISEVYPLETDDRPQDLSHVISEGSEDSMAEERDKSMFVMDSIGHRGLQLFVDMGYPVDNTLVNALVREVLQDKVRTMLGERPDQVDQPQPGTSRQQGEPQWEEPVEEEIREEVPVRGQVVSTPEPTPKASPISSPHRPASPAYTPIPSPPPGREPEPEPETPRVYEPPPPPVMQPQPVVEPESEPESSASYDIKEELRRLADQLRPEVDVGASVQSHHDVATPPESPKPQPPALDMYRTMSPPQLSPRPIEEPMMVTKRSLAAGQSRSPERTPQVSRSDSPKSPKSQPIDEEEEEDLEDQPPPVMFTVAGTQTDVDKETRPRSRTPTPTRDKSRTPSESSYTESSSISESFNECISEGQWLVNKSDGEVADFPVDQVAVRERMLRMAGKRVDVSSASTWKDIDEMEDMDDMSKSEGEFLYKAEFPPEKDPVLDLLARLQTAGPQYGLYNLNQNQVTDVLDHTGKSEGEVIRVAPAARARAHAQQPHPQREEPQVRQVKPAQRRGSPSPRRSPSPMSPKSPKRSKSPQQYQAPQPSKSGAPKRAPSPLYRTQSPTRVSFEDEYVDQRSASPTRGILKQPRNSEGQGRQRREEDYDLPVRDPGRGQSGRLMQGGRQPQARGMIGAGGRSSSPGKSSMRRPPQVIKSSTLPDSYGSGGHRQLKVRGSYEEFRDSMDNTGGLYGSFRGSRSMTPDQMNTDALIQSGYLSQSFSQSETGPRTAQSSLRSSGDMPVSRTSASGRSLGYSYGTESSLTESELRRLATDGTGRLQMSLTIPGIDAEASDLSEIDITDGGK